MSVLTEEEIFAAATQKPRAERAVFLDRACGGDATLRGQVESLLAAYDHPDSLLDVPACQVKIDTHAGATEGPGTVIGQYKLLEQIGEGGFGVVFMADQTAPVRRRVAIKIVKPGMDTRQVVARFEAERQALALMDHANIARVLGGGETVLGRPYFVMELVRGVPITDFFDANQVPVRERLLLFITVCQAVQHAHQKGIIHRDLKPSNIMVTLHDGTPVVKVIDFGIAKALGQQLTDKTLFTNFGQMIGTPIYMSPEQAELSGLDMDTRSDVYSLGVLLYELLTGRTPCDKERLKTAAFDEIRRMIREDEPATPSRCISTMGAAATLVSANRQSDPRRLSQAVRGDLDWIAMKALEKDRNRRYETASALAADVKRFLEDEPVLACPPSASYRLRKFVRRNHRPVLAALLGLLALVAGIIGTTWGMFRATRAEAVAVYEAQQKDEALTGKEAALAHAQDQLFLALIEQARAKRASGRVGQRFEALQAIRAAARIRITPELRTEATAALVLPDVELAQEWERSTVDSFPVVFDAAFQRYARLDKQGNVTLCRWSKGREEVITRLPAHAKTSYYGVTLSADARFVACGYDATSDSEAGGVRVWKLDGPEPAVLLDAPACINQIALAFHASGRQLAIGHPDQTAGVFDLATGRRVQRLALGAAPVHLAFHPREARLAVACGNAVQLFDTESGQELSALRHPAAVTQTSHVTWHPDGRRLAVGCNDRKIYLWDTQTATEVMPAWTGHTADGLVVAFNHAGDRLASVDWDGRTRLWDTNTARTLLTLPGDFGWQFSSDDRLLGPEYSGSRIKLSRLAGGHELRVLRPRSAGSLDNIAGPVVHADGRTLAADSRHQLCFFDLTSGEELAAVRLARIDTARPAYFDPPDLPQGRPGRAAGWMTGGHRGLYFWPTSQDPTRPEVMRIGPPQQIAPSPGGGLSVGASASADGRIVAVPQGNSTLLLNRDHPERRMVLGPQYDVRFCAVSPDGRWVVTCSFAWDGHSKGVRIWDAGSGEQVHELALERYGSAKFSPDGRWLTTTDSTGARQWEVNGWREIRRFERGKFAFSPDSDLLAISDEFSVIRLVETTTGREVARLTGPEPLWYWPSCFSPDGTKLIATCSGETALYVWDLRLIRQQLKELKLDWDWPDFRPATPDINLPKPRHVEVLLGDLGKP